MRKGEGERERARDGHCPSVVYQRAVPHRSPAPVSPGVLRLAPRPPQPLQLLSARDTTATFLTAWAVCPVVAQR